jgi:O-acetyl-ADP-ribose deacetylase (regulator of RNase III)
MRYIQPIKQDLFWAECDLIVIPTNSTLDKHDHLVMGAGVALQAKKRYPDLPKKAGEMILPLCKTMKHPEYLLIRIRVSHHAEIALLQTKTDWRLPSPPELVRKSLKALNHSVKTTDTKSIAMPLPGAGRGGLSREVSLMLVNEELGDLADKIVLCGV